MVIDGTVQFQLPDEFPSLTEKQKLEIKTLMTQYLENKSKFIYDGSFRRESYCYPNSVTTLDSTNINGCMYKGKYILNCGLFAQMIWMGRSISDFTDIPINKITKSFDWGYYFDFLACKKVYGVKKNSSTFYKGNTYTNNNGSKQFITFDNAAAMAQELFQKGFEIPYSKIDIGDLVFYRSVDISDDVTDELEQSSFRYITHVGIVYDMNEGIPTIIESSDVYTAAIGKCGLGNDVTKFGNVRASGIEQRVVMAARHPAAYNKESNVPEKFTKYRGIEVQE